MRVLFFFVIFISAFSVQAECLKEAGDRFTLPGNFVQVAGDENPGTLYKLAQRPEDKKHYIFSIVEAQTSGKWHYYKLKVERRYNDGRFKVLAGHYRLSCSVVDPVAQEPENESKDKQRTETVKRAVKDAVDNMGTFNEIVKPVVGECPPTGVEPKKKIADETTNDDDVIQSTEFYSKTAIAVIKSYEGFEDYLYDCPAGKCTIGYGHLVHCKATGCNYEAESYFRHKDGSPRQISELEALDLLSDDMNQKARAPIQRLVKPEMLEKLNQNQRDALISFVFNIGQGNFAESTLLKRLNAGRFEDVPYEMKRWNKANGKVSNGLVARRAREAQLFETPVN